MIGGAYGEFRGPVFVDEPNSRLLAGQHLLPAHHQIAKGHIRVLVQHRHADLRGKGDGIHAVFDEILFHACHVAAHLLGNDVKRASCRDRADEVVQGSVEGEARMFGMNAVFCNAELRQSPRHKGTQGAVALHHALGLPGGAGGVHHIGASFRRSMVDWFCIGALCHGLCHGLLCQCQSSLRVLQYIGDTLLRICRIDGDVCRPRLVDGNDSGQEFLHPTHFEGHKVARRYALFQKISRDAVGDMLQFPVGEGSFAVNHGGFVGDIPPMLQEEVQPGLLLVVFQCLSGR